MVFNQHDLDKEIRELYRRLQTKRLEYDRGMKRDLPFGELKKIFLEIKELSKRQELCFEEYNSIREGQ